jgi:hypothetical protein
MCSSSMAIPRYTGALWSTFLQYCRWPLQTCSRVFKSCFIFVRSVTIALYDKFYFAWASHTLPDLGATALRQVFFFKADFIAQGDQIDRRPGSEHVLEVREAIHHVLNKVGDVIVVKTTERRHELELDQFWKIVQEPQVILRSYDPEPGEDKRNLLNVLAWMKPQSPYITTDESLNVVTAVNLETD